MNLRESDAKLKDVCRLFEKRVVDVQELQNLMLEVELLTSFDNFSEASIRKIARNPAAYHKSTNKIYVNSTTFFSYTKDIQEALIAHEVGHAIRILTEASPETVELVVLIEIDECIIADRLACIWGYFEPLKRERLNSYGQEYVNCLSLWQDRETFNKCMGVWRIRRLSGQLEK
jgi:hypothetical protein